MAKHSLKKLGTRLRRWVGRPKAWYQATKQWIHSHPKALKDWWLDYLSDFPKLHRSIANAMTKWWWRQLDRLLGKTTFKIYYFFFREFSYSLEPAYKEYLYKEYKKWWRRNVWDIKVPLLFLGLVIGMGIWIGLRIEENWDPESKKNWGEFLPVIFPLVVAAGFFIQAIFAQIRETWKRKEAERLIIWGCLYQFIKPNLNIPHLIYNFREVGDARLSEWLRDVFIRKANRLLKNYKGDPKVTYISYESRRELIFSSPKEWEDEIKSLQKKKYPKDQIEWIIKDCLGTKFEKEIHLKSPSFHIEESIKKDILVNIENTRKEFQKTNLQDLPTLPRIAILRVMDFYEKGLKNSTYQNMRIDHRISHESFFDVHSTCNYLYDKLREVLETYLYLINQVSIDFNTHKIVHGWCDEFDNHVYEWNAQRMIILKERSKEVRLEIELLNKGFSS